MSFAKAFFLFLSTPSARRATCILWASIFLPVHFYPRPLRGGRHSPAKKYLRGSLFLSTPSARRATFGGLASGAKWNDFYPRPLRGGRLMCAVLWPSTSRFLSTPSARRATTAEVLRDEAKEFLSTPSARRATAKTETKSLFSNKLYNILHEFRRALIYNGSKSYPNHAK